MSNLEDIKTVRMLLTWQVPPPAFALFFLLPMSCYLPIVISLSSSTCFRDIYTRCIVERMLQEISSDREALPQPLIV